MKKLFAYFSLLVWIRHGFGSDLGKRKGGVSIFSKRSFG
jgi:hypothetical protein